jgi:hypothetical protein
MASPSVDPDIEAQTKGITGTQTKTQLPIIPNPPPTANAAHHQLPISADVDPQPQATNTNQDHDGNPPVQQPPANSQVQLGMFKFFCAFTSYNLNHVIDENHGDSSDGLWSMYLTESEKQDAEVTGSWKGDTDGILVFVSPGLPVLCIFTI